MRKLYFIVLAILFFLSFSVLYGQSTEEFFERNCFSCHTIGGGRLTGPDLKNVDQRKDTAWLEKFILNPEVILRGGDPYAAKLLKEARGVRMTRVAGLTSGLVKNLLKFIKEESAKEKTRFAKSALKERPLTPEDIVLGRQFFLGTLPLTNKGPACLGCHSIAGEGFFGGGNLGPDLTSVIGRLGGKTALMAWLSNPSSATMSPIYRKQPLDEEEILPLVAFFKSKSEKNASYMEVHDFNFMIFGFIGLILVLLIFDLLWGKRLRSVREKLVKGELE